jgi:hypothetical protein
MLGFARKWAWSYPYDVNGNLPQQMDARNEVIIFTCDRCDRLTKLDSYRHK